MSQEDKEKRKVLEYEAHLKLTEKLATCFCGKCVVCGLIRPMYLNMWIEPYKEEAEQKDLWEFFNEEYYEDDDEV